MSEQSSSISLDDYFKFYPSVTFNVDHKKITYYTPNYTTLWRCKEIMNQEPETMDWISSFTSDQILVDIGANVGIYSIWAAVTTGVTVYCFEPESKNYSILNENIRQNNLQESVTSYCMAISDEIGLGDLFLGQTNAGGSGHTFGQSTGHMLEPMTAAFRQGSISFPLDHLVSNGSIPCPNLIKIDVDGIEHKVVEGLIETLKNDAVKSVLIELNTSYSPKWCFGI